MFTAILHHSACARNGTLPKSSCEDHTRNDEKNGCHRGSPSYASKIHPEPSF